MVYFRDLRLKKIFPVNTTLNRSGLLYISVKQK